MPAELLAFAAAAEDAEVCTATKVATEVATKDTECGAAAAGAAAAAAAAAGPSGPTGATKAKGRMAQGRRLSQELHTGRAA